MSYHELIVSMLRSVTLKILCSHHFCVLLDREDVGFLLRDEVATINRPERSERSNIRFVVNQNDDSS